MRLKSWINPETGAFLGTYPPRMDLARGGAVEAPKRPSWRHHWRNGAWVEEAPTHPTMSKRELLKRLRASGKKGRVRAALKALDADQAEDFAAANEIDQDDPVAAVLAEAAGLSLAELFTIPKKEPKA